ncbi:MAG: dicarboxylate-CoA ligase PimA [Frankiales bacterium]|nr:dicarboxylate-CoA ligase PimA [Frankiales bacterium]
MTQSLRELLLRAATSFPERPAVVTDDETLTFAELRSRVRRFAAALTERGVGRGSRVAVLLPNTAWWPVVWLALAEVGAVVVPVHRQAQEADLRHLLDDSQAELVVALPSTGVPQGVPLLELGELPTEGIDGDGDVDDVLSLQYTSGTTGLPKGCVLTQGYWTRLAEQAAGHDPGLSASDVLLTAQPFSYIDPQWNLTVGLLTGCALVVLDGFHPSTFMAKVRQHQVTVFYTLGVVPQLLLAQPSSEHDRAHQLRHVLCSGIPAAMHAEVERRFGVPWYELYGSTEIGGAALAVSFADHPSAVGTGWLGSPATGFEVRVEPTGELLVRSPNPMLGYWTGDGTWQDPRVDGWFATGDLVADLGDGRLAFAGRAGDRIRRAGENISALEVESVLESLPAVRLAAVVPEPDPLRGQEVHAVLETDGPVDVRDLLEQVSAKLARFKVPRFWTFVELPRTVSGKVAKAELSELHAPRYDATAGAWS